MASLRAAARGLAHASGVLALRHRLRHRDTLTVAMFHRVTAPGTAAARRADPVYSLSAPLFEACLGFFRRHYTVVGLDQVCASLDGGPALPPRSLLLTFDDGWQDNVDVAVPILRRHGLPAAVFVPAVALEDDPGGWWQEILLRRVRERPAEYAALWRMAGPGDPPDPLPGGPTLAMLLRWEALDPAARQHLLAPWTAEAADEGQHLIGPSGLAALVRAGIGIGAHGAAHLPLTLLGDPASDLARSRAALLAVMGTAPETMSFPHGRYDFAVLAAAGAQGFRVAFTSDSCLNAMFAGHPASRLLGRISIEAAALTDAAGRFAPSRLATWLFHRPVRQLDDAAFTGAGRAGGL